MPIGSSDGSFYESEFHAELGRADNYLKGIDALKERMPEEPYNPQDANWASKIYDTAMPKGEIPGSERILPTGKFSMLMAPPGSDTSAQEDRSYGMDVLGEDLAKRKRMMNPKNYDAEEYKQQEQQEITRPPSGSQVVMSDETPDEIKPGQQYAMDWSKDPRNPHRDTGINVIQIDPNRRSAVPSGAAPKGPETRASHKTPYQNLSTEQQIQWRKHIKDPEIRKQLGIPATESVDVVPFKPKGK